MNINLLLMSFYLTGYIIHEEEKTPYAGKTSLPACDF
jgi:hypothetical protein